MVLCSDALARVFEKSNLKRAWRWISTSPDQLYRDFCASAYSDFSLYADELLDEIHDQLVTGTYDPSHARKIYLPKQDRTARTYTILSARDQVIYQAFVNIVADYFVPVARPGYLTQSFGHLYAGRTSRTFYRDWRVCRRTYIGKARIAVASGLEYTATFDLTACYDTISHSVIKQLLSELGLERDFCNCFCEYLNAWTAHGRGIALATGIPQGPLGSGLIADLVLHDFDVRLVVGRQMRYLRYVDDIRLFGRSANELELRLRELVEISKGLGLNPQSSKLGVHRVLDINAELKSISSPPEDWDTGAVVDQRRLVRRILELTRRSQVQDDTRLKYALSHAHPTSRINERLVRTLDCRQDLVHSIIRYFKKYPRLPGSVTEAFVGRIRGPVMPASVRAALLDSTDGRLGQRHEDALNKLAKSVWRSTDLPGDVRLVAGRRVLKSGLVTRTQLPKMLRQKDWWFRSEFARSLTDDVFARRDLATALARAACDQHHEVAIAAAVRIVKLQLKIASPGDSLHPFAARILRKAKRRPCVVDYAFRKLLGNRIPRLRWRPFLGAAAYSWVAEQALECERCSRTNITAFVNALDALIDRVLLALFSFDTRLGSYQLGNVGGVLNSKRLAQLYPRTFRLTREIHGKRGLSRYSHAVHKHSGRPTKTIEWTYLPTAKRLISEAFKELEAVI